MKLRIVSLVTGVCLLVSVLACEPEKNSKPHPSPVSTSIGIKGGAGEGAK